MLFYQRPVFIRTDLEVLEETSIHKLCEESGLRPRVTSSMRSRLFLVKGDKNYEFDGAKYIGVEGFANDRPAMCRQTIESLAYGFFDYEAREIMAFENQKKKMKAICSGNRFFN